MRNKQKNGAVTPPSFDLPETHITRQNQPSPMERSLLSNIVIGARVRVHLAAGGIPWMFNVVHSPVPVQCMEGVSPLWKMRGVKPGLDSLVGIVTVEHVCIARYV